MESSESKPESYRERVKKFGNILLNEGLAVEVRHGLDLDASEYEYIKGDEFAINDAIGVICRFLSLPMYIDGFDSHDARVATFNETSKVGKLSEDFKELYFHNKLRTNRLNPVINTIGTLSRMRGNPPELNIFLKEQIQSVSLVGYAELPVSEKLAIVSSVEQLGVAALNKMIEIGAISGPQITP